MASRTNRLYLIKIEFQAVAIIPAKGMYDAVIRYLARIGFAGPYAYFRSHLMTNTKLEINCSFGSRQHFVTANTKTISGDILSISSQPIANYDAIFSLVDLSDINIPLFVRPTIEEVRNCAGFSKEPMYKLRKFCT